MKLAEPTIEILKERLRAQRRIVKQLEDQGNFSSATKAFDKQLEIIHELQTRFPTYDFKDV